MEPNLKPPKAPRHWRQRFLYVASVFAGFSKDPSTRVGAVAVRDRRILATGYNGFPQGVRDTPDRLKHRDTRLAMTIHAEMNLIAFAARNGVCLAASEVYVWPLMTCSHCAGLLIQADVSKIIIPDFVEPLRWQHSFQAARDMLIEANIVVERIPMRGPINPMLEEDEEDDIEEDVNPYPAQDLSIT